MESLEGINAFQSLTTLTISSKENLANMDLSENLKLTTLNLTDVGVKKLTLGDISVETLTIGNNYSRAKEELSIAGSKLKTLSVAYDNSYAVWYDNMKTIDLSGCPALETANCKRGGKKLTAVYISQHQKTRMDNGQLAITLLDGVDPGIIKVKQ